MEQKYYNTIVDKLLKTVKTIEVAPDSCIACIQKDLKEAYGLTWAQTQARFGIFYSDVPYCTIKKYVKWKVV